MRRGGSRRWKEKMEWNAGVCDATRTRLHMHVSQEGGGGGVLCSVRAYSYHVPKEAVS